jgi:hypothetical protein
MLRRTSIALLITLSACATTNPSPAKREAPSPSFANLQRAAQYPWTDDGHCVVREASNEWPVLAERCYHALDHDRVRFRDVTRKCAVASAPAAAAALGGVGLCLFASPVVVTGAVIVIGTVVVAVVIKEGLDAYERSASRERAKREVQTRPSNEEAPVTNREPKPEGLGRDWVPTDPPGLEPRERRPECTPRRVPPKGGNNLHNKCADRIPFNAVPGANALVNGKAFDGWQVVAGVLWEIKTDNFDSYPLELQNIVINKNVRDFLAEQELARACGFDFRVGVRSATHKAMLETQEPRLRGVIVLMDWC